jgi:hypothetical protein
MSQLPRLLAYLKAHNGITTLEASDHLRICRLSERIRELEKLNYVFEHRAEKTSGGARVVRYLLISEPERIAA